MPDASGITVENKLISEKRDINVYHHSSRGAHIISYNGSLTLSLGAVEDNDYLHISVTRGPGNLWKGCVIDVPSWPDFEFSSEGHVTVTHSGKRTLLRIPPGPPTWQLKITRRNKVRQIWGDKVTVGNDGPGGTN
jgi:hypothetical protein